MEPGKKCSKTPKVLQWNAKFLILKSQNFKWNCNIFAIEPNFTPIWLC